MWFGLVCCGLVRFGVVWCGVVVERHGTQVMVLMWQSQDNVQKSVLAFYHVSSVTQTQDVRLGDKHLCPLSNLRLPQTGCLFVCLFLLSL